MFQQDVVDEYLYFILITLIQLTSVHIKFGKHVACMHKNVGNGYYSGVHPTLTS